MGLGEMLAQGLEKAVAWAKPPVATATPKPTSAPSDHVKKLFASMETSGNMHNYLQLEKSTFDDMKKRGKVAKGIEFKHLVDPAIYDKVAKNYIDDIMTTFKIPTIEEAALWSYRPGWYKKYNGKINAIPPKAKGSFGKSGQEVMKIRKKLMNDYLKGVK